MPLPLRTLTREIQSKVHNVHNVRNVRNVRNVH